jgi:hypothetical protein
VGISTFTSVQNLCHFLQAIWLIGDEKSGEPAGFCWSVDEISIGLDSRLDQPTENRFWFPQNA